MICSNNCLFQKEVQHLRKLFSANNYPTWYFNKILKRFEDSKNQQSTQTEEADYSHIIGIPFLGKTSKTFAKRLNSYIAKKYNIRICTYFTSQKIGSYFQLKCPTPVSLLSKVVYKFTCSRDATETYIGMSTRHLVTRAREHFNLKNNKSAISQHLQKCSTCNTGKFNLSSFCVMKKCRSNFATKIQEALLIKKQNPTMNRQLYENGSSFLLNIY